ncbi:uncharacterized protein EI90DRAFT_3065791 [Cantharellus anzutake]|uniref:uncharacterized protein n=1 Tax=Cantharellus anzutake TaxID=1750568 RepID=UPI0019067B94|nr:uncharacterized protein EI90DRAFT_3065791 [Cantharellus anzutake]KAF8328170.1 hypothetical protein EI90DRAFT_3065791 [Cantharellus anzutake]
MHRTIPISSKASRLPMTSKMGNKDYYKGTRAAFVPGGHRTGAPGKHIRKGKGDYRLIDEHVRFFVAPPLANILASPLKPYVYSKIVSGPNRAVYGKLDKSGFDGFRYLQLARLQQPGHEAFVK